MPIYTEERKAGPYAGDDVQTSFPFSFKVFDVVDVVAVLTDPGGVETNLSLGTDYRVTLNANQDTAPGGSVDRFSALPAGYLLTITSDVEATQPVELTNQGGFYPKVINTALDRLTILVQQLKEQVGRAVKTSISDDGTPDQLLSSLSASVAAAGQSATIAETAADIAVEAAEIAQSAAGIDTSNLALKTGDNATGIWPISISGTAANIANGIVTFAKMAAMSTAKLLGRSSSGSGAPEEISIGSGLSLSGGALSCTVTNATTLSGYPASSFALAANAATDHAHDYSGLFVSKAMSYGAMGSLAYLTISTGSVAPGVSVSGGIFSGNPAGTWRNLSDYTVSATGETYQLHGLFQRIA